MAKSLYTAQAHVVGGRDQGHGVTSDGALDVQLRTPVEMGGDGGGTNPEQLFAVGYAACFEGALGVVGRREHVDLGAVAIDSEVSLITTENRGFTVAVGLDVSLPGSQRCRAGHFDRGRRPRGLPVLQRHPRQHRGDPEGQRQPRPFRSACSQVTAPAPTMERRAMSGHDPLVPPSGHTPEGGVLLGDTDARRSMVLFEDPQCPYCREFEELNGARITAALAAGELAVEYRMRCFLGPESVRADNALALAAEAGRFDELRHELFAAQPPEGTGGFTNEDLLRLGAQVGLNAPDFVSGVRRGPLRAMGPEARDALSSGGPTGNPGRVAQRQPDRLRGALRPAGVREATARLGR